MYTFVGDGFFSQSRLSRHNCRVNKPENTRMIASYFTLNNSYKETLCIFRIDIIKYFISSLQFWIAAESKEFNP